jgi:hypothetical protein
LVSGGGERFSLASIRAPRTEPLGIGMEGVGRQLVSNEALLAFLK